MSSFARSNNGLVHLISAVNGEYTLCGNAFEGEGAGEDDPNAWVEVSRGPVTCPECAREIQNCRGVAVRLDESFKEQA